jgi:hypothetical protein
MTSNLQVGTLLRAAVLSLAPLAFAASTALADPPGYYFQDSMQPVPPRSAATPPVAAPLVGGYSAPSVGENARPRCS